MYPITGDIWALPNGGSSINGSTAKHMETIPVPYPRQDKQYLIAVFQTDSGDVDHLPYFKANDLDPCDPNAYSWGFFPNDIPITELDVLERYRSAIVIVTDDAWLAHRINQTLASLNEPNHAGVVATAFWAGASRMKDYALLPLRGRRIVYLPTLQRDTIAVGVELRGRLQEIGIEDFRVLIKPFANSGDVIEAARTECGAYACEKAMTFSRRNVICLLDDVQNAWSFSQYKKYCKDEKFIEAEMQPTEEAKPTLFIPATSISDAAKNGGVDVAFSIESVFAPSNITVVVGDSNAGKSMFTRTLAISISTGTSAFGMEASRARKVYSINAEQDYQKSNTYTIRAMAALGVTEIPDRFFDFPELSMPAPEGFGPLDVLDTGWQDLILDKMDSNSVLIIDNLLAASQKGLSSEAVGRGLKNFAKRLQAKQNTLIVVHHTTKKGDPMGSNAFKSLAQNVILIHESEQRKGFEGGVNALVTFREFKGCPPYTGKQFHAHLEYATEAEGTPWVFDEVGADSSEAESAPRTKPDVAGLHEIEQAALLHAYEHGRVTKSDLVNQGFNEGTVKDHLAALVKANRLEKRGKGPGTHYVLPEATS
ncbi:AAA family ATPase [Pseudodesulfovibrio profundus]|nr:AAA family ATPase [Pseudodesulfovibrio profundus]